MRMIRPVLVGALLASLGLIGSVPPAGAHITGEKYHQGFTLLASSTAQVDSDQATRALDDMARLGANEVVIVVPLVQATVSSTTITPRWDTPTDDQLRRAIANARARGLAAVLKFHLELKDGAWRSKITFSNAQDAQSKAWHESWRAWMVHYGTLAKETHVRAMVLGVEQFGTTMDSCDTRKAVPQGVWSCNKHNTSRWVDTVKAVRKATSGAEPKVQLTYAAYRGSATRTREATRLGRAFVKALDYIEVTYYVGPNHGAETTTKQIRAEMEGDRKPFFDKIWTRYKKSIVIGETGQSTGDADLQGRWYEALLGFANAKKSKHIVGVDFFRHYTDSTGDFAMKVPARKVVAGYFGGQPG